MALKLRKLHTDEVEICRENGIDPDGAVVMLRNDTYLVIMRHKTRDEITIRFGEARLRKMKGGKED